MSQFQIILSQALQDITDGESLIGMDCNTFARRVLGVSLWRKQRLINDALNSVYERLSRGDETCPRHVVVGTGHGIGKTMDAAVIAIWALACWNPPPVVITSAPTFRQVKDQLWREIRQRWNGTSRLAVLANALTTRINLGDKHYAYGFSTNQPARFQGIHADWLLFIIDEANGFPEDIWEAIDSCMTGQRSIVFAIGNTIVPYGHFFRMFDNDRAITFRISSREHPNVRARKELIPGAVTAQWIEEFEDKYKEVPQIIGSRIDARFPDSAEDTLISRSIFNNLFLPIGAKTLVPTVLGVDVARYGSNLTVATLQRGQLLSEVRSWEKASTTETTRRIELLFHERGTDYIVVDDDGVGGGVVDQLRDKKLPVIPFNGGGRAFQPEKFVNKITEAYWFLKEGLERKLLLASEKNYDLELQCTTRAYEVLPQGLIKLEPKKKYCERTGLQSPDFSDSWAMAVWQVMKVWLKREDTIQRSGQLEHSLF